MSEHGSMSAAAHDVLLVEGFIKGNGLSDTLLEPPPHNEASFEEEPLTDAR